MLNDLVANVKDQQPLVNYVKYKISLSVNNKLNNIVIRTYYIYTPIPLLLKIKTLTYTPIINRDLEPRTRFAIIHSTRDTVIIKSTYNIEKGKSKIEELSNEL